MGRILAAVATVVLGLLVVACFGFAVLVLLAQVFTPIYPGQDPPPDIVSPYTIGGVVLGMALLYPLGWCLARLWPEAGERLMTYVSDAVNGRR